MKFSTAIAAFFGIEAVLAAPKPIDLGDGVTLVPREPTMQKRRAARLTLPKITAESAEVASLCETHPSYSPNVRQILLIVSPSHDVANESRCSGQVLC